jgi:hypothetical protein
MSGDPGYGEKNMRIWIRKYLDLGYIEVIMILGNFVRWMVGFDRALLGAINSPQALDCPVKS